MMLAALTYCYALGLFSSRDIEEMMRTDRGFRALCGMEFPDWRRLRRFRRHNREALRRTLEETIRRTWSLNGGDHRQRPRYEMTQTNELLPASAPSGESPPSDWFTAEAEHRIECAMFIDQMALED